jgi:hypothetical protein
LKRNKQLESDLYYQTEQTFDIVNGNHQNLQNQDSNSSVPAIIDLDFLTAIHKAMGGVIELRTASTFKH